MKPPFLFVSLSLFSILSKVVLAQKNCNEAPEAWLRKVCEQLKQWDRNARAAPPVTTSIVLPPAIPGLPAPPLAAELAPIPMTPYQCMDMQCLSSYTGGRATTKAIRKEYRMLSDEERSRFNAAMRAIKQNGEFDRIATIHAQVSQAGGAHAGPAFLPWHREYIKRVEIALRQVDPGVAMAYWDSTLESALPTPRDSHMFSENFMGDTDTAGNVVRGTFAGWRTLQGRANIQRRVGADGRGYLEQEIQRMLGQTQIEMVLGYPTPQQGCQVPTSFFIPEYTHNNVHLFVGGDMGDTSTAANDPIFYLHHSFVDLLWEEWRLGHQGRQERESTYPMDNQQCASAQHFASAQMRPFQPWQNYDGLSNKYTDNLYQYMARPSCAMGPSCGSRYLFCLRGHCAAKVKPGGNCRGLEGLDSCLHGVCQGGRCVQTQPTPVTTPRPPSGTRNPLSSSCFNEHECCAVWTAKGECQRNPTYMQSWCKASCRQCQPTYNLNTECADRHPSCRGWATQGECTRNQFWMAENCRQSCNKCQVTRLALCSGGGGAQSGRVTVAPPPSAKCSSPGCFNENVCCQLWGLMGECKRNSAWMTCNCRVSCGDCIPQDYTFGTCSDYHPQCSQWALSGECGRNPWMVENCKRSCQSCKDFWELRAMCQGSRSGSGRRRRIAGSGYMQSQYAPSLDLGSLHTEQGAMQSMATTLRKEKRDVSAAAAAQNAPVGPPGHQKESGEEQVAVKQQKVPESMPA